jgi:hypothetical protein
MKLKALAVVVGLVVINTACSEVGPEGSSPVAPTSQSQAAKPSPSTTQIPATVTFSDRVGDAIRSDGGGTYVNGGRLEVVLYTQSKDLVMRGGSRALSLSYTNPLNGTGPVGTTVVNDIFMNIHGILDMVPGTSLIKGATFRRNAREVFQFNNTYHLDATKVSVVRDTATKWTVTADDPTTGRAVLLKNGTALGVYAMPFQLTVVCSSCS